MGHQYQAIQWNKNKIAYDLYAIIAVALFIGVFVSVGLATHPSGHTADPVVLLMGKHDPQGMEDGRIGGYGVFNNLRQLFQSPNPRDDLQRHMDTFKLGQDGAGQLFSGGPHAARDDDDGRRLPAFL